MSEPRPEAPVRVPKRRRLLPKLAAASLAFLFSFLVCEVAARLVFPAPPDPAREPQIVYVLSKEVGYLHLPNQRGWIDDGFVTINALGFRGSEPRSPRPSGVPRLLVVGSSNSVGWGVQDDETYCALLERTLPETLRKPAVEVLNWSVSGYKLEHKEQLLRQYGLALDPDYVLLDFSDYDLFAPDATPQAAPASKPVSLPSDGPLAIPHTGQTFRLIAEPSGFSQLLRRSRALYSAKNGLYGLKVTLTGQTSRAANEVALLEGNESPDIADAWQRADATLARVRDLTAHLGGRVGLLIFPVREQVSKSYPQAIYQTRLAELATKHGFFLVDPLTQFREHARRCDELFIPYDRGHPGPLGHRLLAEAIRDALPRR